MSAQTPAIPDCVVRELEADTRRKIGRLPEHQYSTLQLDDGDIIELEGKNRTLVYAESDLNRQEDGVAVPEFVANAAGASTLGRVTVRKADPPDVEEAALTPLSSEHFMWPGAATSGMQNHLAGTPVTESDRFAIDGAGPTFLPVVVKSVTPSEGGQLTESTSIYFE